MTQQVDCILLIDDNEADNFLHKLTIEESGCAKEVIAIDEAEVALEQLKQGEIKPNIILLDINMPRMNGWEFIDAYRELPENDKHAMIVMMLTTSLNPEDRDAAGYSPPLSGFHNKPLTVEMCHKIIAQYFDEQA